MNKVPQTKQGRRQAQREERRHQEAQRARQTRQRRITLIVSIIVAGVVIAGGGIFFALNNLNKPTSSVTAATASTTATATSTTATATVAVTANTPYAPVDGISCYSTEQLAYHIHAHISIYINGNAVQVPQGIGIASDGSCIYWLHTHNTDGIIHIESPAQKTYTLGNFLDEWQQRFRDLGYPSQLGLIDGWKIYVNGKPYSGTLQSIPLNAHALITLTYNSPNAQPDTTYSWQGL
jgi:hypothetical protein